MNVTETKLTLKTLAPRESTLIRGPHGIGKSEVVRQVVKELSEEEGVAYQLIDLRLSQKEVGDLIGMPRAIQKFTGTKIVYENGKLVQKTYDCQDVTVYNPPNWFPTDPDSHGFLFLDEMNRATREVQQAAFELVLDYRLNFVELPIGWKVIAAVNNDTDTYSVLEIDPALMDRFQVIDFMPTDQEWLDHANSVGVEDFIIKYITKFPSNLYPPDKVEPDKIYPSPRSWVRLSATAVELKKRGIDVLEQEHASYFIKRAGTRIGGTLAVHLADFIRKDYKVLTAEDILNKYTDKMDKDFKKMQLAEIAYCNKLLIEYAKKSKISKPQGVNLLKYYKAINKEAGADFWNSFIREVKDEAVKWWHANPEVSKVTSQILGKQAALGV
jgi:MoxR-like ATPase